VNEVAEMTGASPATIKRQWAIAKAWLYDALSSKGLNETADTARS
jgi:ECF sigma factor